MHKRAKFNTSKNFGIVTVDGTECHYVVFSNELREVHIWVATGDEPLVKTYSIIDKTDKGEVRMNTTPLLEEQFKRFRQRFYLYSA